MLVPSTTSHFGGESLFQLSGKDFASPLGTFPAARAVIEDLSTAYGKERSFRDEFLHKREHSLELQLPFFPQLHDGHTDERQE